MKKQKNSQRDLKDINKEGPQSRAFLLAEFNTRTVDQESRTVELSFSSEEPYQRWWGMEVLGHQDEEIDLTRLGDGTAAFLVNHDWDDQVGVVEKVWIENGRGRALVRFGNSARASEIFQDIVDGIRTQVSVGYFIKQIKLVEENEDEPDLYRVTRWEPYEISIVSVAADVSVGVGRNLEAPEVEIIKSNSEKKVSDMEKDEEKVKAPVDVKAERQAAQAAERARVNELLAAGSQYGADDVALRLIDAGGSIHDFNQEVLERSKGQKATKAENPEIGLSEKESQDYSFLRVMNALANPNNKGAQEAAAFELECNEAAQKTLGRAARGENAIIVPQDVLTRAMSAGSAANGGNVISTDLMTGSFIESLENAMALTQCGITTLSGLNGNIAIPRQNGGASMYWLAENGAPTETNGTFEQIAMTPKTAGAFTELSRQLLLQSGINIEAFARMEIIKRLALGLDFAGIAGDGTGNSPIGIMNANGVGIVPIDTNGGAPTWDHVVDLETDIADSNADIGSMCYLTNAKMRGKLKKTKLDAGSGNFIWDNRAGDTPLNGYRSVISNQVPSNLAKGTGTDLSAALFGNFSDLIMGLWGGLDLMVDPYTKATSGAVRIVALQSVDYCVRHPESFSIIEDAITG